MRAFINSDEYSGTPEEIAKFMSLREGKSYDNDYPVSPDPMVDIISDSQKLREKLAANPAYSPFGGVVPSKEDEVFEDTQAFGVSDTGVTL